MVINKIQLITKNANGDEDINHPETSADIVKMTEFSSLSVSGGLIADTDSALQAIKKLQNNIQRINVFSGTNGITPGTFGYVPAPTINDKNKYLKSDGNWSELELDSASVNSANKANKLSNSVNLQTDLSKSSATPFDGSSNVSIGITGVLPLANGGTNASTLPNARKSLFGEDMTVSNSKYFLTINENHTNGGYLSIANVKSLLDINNIDNTTDSDKIVAKANALSNPVNLITDLASTNNVSFDGTKNSAIGVSGILPITSGGTGQSSLSEIQAGKDSDGNPINSTYAKLSGAIFSGDVKTTSKFIGNLEGNATTATKLQSGEESFVNTFRNVWFSDNLDNDKRVYNSRFQYNPNSNILKVGSIQSNVSIITDLESTEPARLNGVTEVYSGISGILSEENGGTGQNSLDEVVVGKANELQTSRSINGIFFNGSSSISNYTECITEADNANKTVECPNFILERGSRITVLFSIANTADNPTLNVSSTGAKPIYYRGYPIPPEAIQDNSLYDLVYNGNYWLVIGSIVWVK